MVLATSGVLIMPLLEASRRVPIVFAQTIDPVGLGVVESLSRPGGNITGFTQFEYSIPPKWLELLKEIAPATTHAAVLRDPFDPPGLGQWAALQSVASVFAIELRVVNVRDKDAIESGIRQIAEFPNAGLLITASAPANVHRDLILQFAERLRLPAIYPPTLSQRAVSPATDLTRRSVPSRGRLCRPHPEGREAGRVAGAGPNQVRAGDQPQDRQGARPRNSASLLARADEVIE